jgi:hypothetical protein
MRLDRCFKIEHVSIVNIGYEDRIFMKADKELKFKSWRFDAF